MNKEIKEIFNKYGKEKYNDEYCLEFETYIIELQELKKIYDYITNLQAENKRLNYIIDETLKYAKYQCENFEPYKDTKAKLFSVIIIMMLENKNILKGEE